MADPIDKIIEEVKALEEKPLLLTKPQAEALLACVSLTAAFMGSPRRKHLTILDPGLILPMALVYATDPKVEMIEETTIKLTEFIDPKLAAEWKAVSDEVDSRG